MYQRVPDLASLTEYVHQVPHIFILALPSLRQFHNTVPSPPYDAFQRFGCEHILQRDMKLALLEFDQKAAVLAVQQIH
jgi:hypothetical protein